MNYSTTQSFILLLARILLAVLFIIAGIDKMGVNYAVTEQYMIVNSVPSLLLPYVILLEVIGGIMLIIGLMTRAIAIIFASFTFTSALIFHTDFTYQLDVIRFYQNLAIVGGFSILAVNEPGSFSIDSYHASKNK